MCTQDQFTGSIFLLAMQMFQQCGNSAFKEKVDVESLLDPLVYSITVHVHFHSSFVF